MTMTNADGSAMLRCLSRILANQSPEEQVIVAPCCNDSSICDYVRQCFTVTKLLQSDNTHQIKALAILV